MNQQIDLYKLVASIGKDASLKLIENGIVERHVMHSILKEYDQLNKDTYSSAMNSFNDGNNSFEDCIYIESFEKCKFSHSHTMSDNVDMVDLLNDKPDDSRLQLFKRAMERIVNLHKKFGVRHADAILWLTIVTNQVK